jgi:hypothetical protein
MTNYPILHLDINESKETACSKQSSKLDFQIYWPENFKIRIFNRFYWKNLAKVTGPNQFSLAVGHRTTAKVDDWVRKDIDVNEYERLSNITLT